MLYAGIYVDRESLLRKKRASVIVRPQLLVNGTIAPLRVLENVCLSIVSIDEDDVRSMKEVPNFELFDDRDSVHEFQVPENVRMFEFQLKAKVKIVSQGKTIDLQQSRQFGLNKIDETDAIEDEHLQWSSRGYRLLALGESTGGGWEGGLDREQEQEERYSFACIDRENGRAQSISSGGNEVQAPIAYQRNLCSIAVGRARSHRAGPTD